MKTHLVYFNDGQTSRIECDSYSVGPAGELDLIRKDDGEDVVVMTIAPGVWTSVCDDDTV